jgi:methylenetetrahydrofolate--tRNA-(uracil-5-)-methyltransferase
LTRKEPKNLMKTSNSIVVVGGGLAGCEAAWQCLRAGYSVELREMRPTRLTAAHQTGHLAELVCSNSLKSLTPESAPGLLKNEMSALDSLIVRAGLHARVPADKALAVDRLQFSAFIEQALNAHPNFRRVDTEVDRIPTEAELNERGEVWIIATGPLTSGVLSSAIRGLTGSEADLYFYDAIAPVIDADTIDMSQCFFANRYGNGEEGDYLNIPLSKEQYYAFVEAVKASEKMPLHEFEEPRYFESCLPIEVMIERGVDTLRFGPMKPTGFNLALQDAPRPYAVIQLRAENRDRTMFSMVGFQTKMKWPEQRRVFTQLVPGLKDAEFFRFGSVHRNTYIEGPKLLNANLSLRANRRVFMAGQITGVEGYTESAAIGLIAGRSAAAFAADGEFATPPAETVIGSLVRYVTFGGTGDFQPMNANFGLLPRMTLPRHLSKADKKLAVAARARQCFEAYLNGASVPDPALTMTEATAEIHS